MIGLLTAVVAFLVDVAEITVSDYKMGYCTTNWFRNREACCVGKNSIAIPVEKVGEHCEEWHSWSTGYLKAFMIYVGIALLWGIVAGAVTITTKASLPVATSGEDTDHTPGEQGLPKGKTMYSKQNLHTTIDHFSYCAVEVGNESKLQLLDNIDF